MKIAIVGCGAIGGYVGAKLALAGEAVTVLARGATLEAVRARVADGEQVKEFIRKPFQLGELVTLVRKTLSAKA